MITRIFSLLFVLFPLLVSAQLVGDKENGLAGYYSSANNGATTKYNVIYDKDELVAAHRQFPFNSTVRVENMDNGKSVVVRIIDEGPFIRGRIIDLSERAAAAIDLLGKVSVPVEITLLSVPGQAGQVVAAPAPIINDPVVEPAPTVREETTPDRQASPAPSTSPAPAAAPRVARDETRADTRTGDTGSAPTRRADQAPGPAPTNTGAGRAVKARTVSDKSELVRQQRFSSGVYKIELKKVDGGQHGVQVGSFNNLERAMDKVTEMQSKWFDNVLIERIGGTGGNSTYKVILGPFESDKVALRYASDLKKRYKIDGFTVELK